MAAVKYEAKKKRIAEYRPAEMRRRAVGKWKPSPVTGHPNITPSIAAFPVGARDFAGLVMDKRHLGYRVKEMYEQPDIDLEDVEVEELIKVH